MAILERCPQCRRRMMNVAPISGIAGCLWCHQPYIDLPAEPTGATALEMARRITDVNNLLREGYFTDDSQFHWILEQIAQTVGELIEAQDELEKRIHRIENPRINIQ